jgi:peptidoglycan/LPS O-acetylase OafA/YrhL
MHLMDKVRNILAITTEKRPPVDSAGSSLEYRPELDGLRGISIMLVLTHHFYYPLLPGGFFGVDIFFVLSGFLITSLLVKEWNQKGKINLKNFYFRRVLRLIPALILFMLVTGIVALLFLTQKEASKTYQGIWLTLCYASNWFYAFRSFSASNLLGITWSLAIEEQFYTTWPIILLLAHKLRLRRPWVLCALPVTVMIIAFHRKMLAEHGASILRLYYASDTRADALLIGCFIGLLFAWELFPRNSIRFEIWIKSLATGSLIFLAYMVGTASWGDMFLYTYGGYTLIAVAIGLILIVLIVRPPKGALLFLNFAPLVWIGRVSYGLYLWHWPVRELIYPKNNIPTSVTQLVLVIVLSLLLTSVSYYLVEKQFLHLKNHFS